jgi:hypothetical protein
MAKQNPNQETKELPVDKATTLVLDESRMILPGIQALFGFQLMVVFSDAFSEKLSMPEQRLHLLSIALLLITTMSIMAQPVFHRQTSVKHVEDEFVHIASRLMLLGMVPLVISVCLEFYLISRLILENVPLSILFSLGIFALFLLFWLGLPRIEALQRLLGRKR